MATYDAAVNLKAFEAMEQGRKTVYALPCSVLFADISSGDRVEFGALGYVTAGTVRKYASLEALLEAEGPANVVPDAPSLEAAAQDLRRAPEWKHQDEEAGVLALRVREARRKV